MTPFSEGLAMTFVIASADVLVTFFVSCCQFVKIVLDDMTPGVPSTFVHSTVEVIFRCVAP